MSSASLDLRYHPGLFDPIFVSSCALMQSITAIFKSIKSKKNFYKLEIEDLKKADETKQLLLTQEQIQTMEAGHPGD